MVKATKPILDILQSCSGHASHWVNDVEFESVVAVWALVFALKITDNQLVVYCIYAGTRSFRRQTFRRRTFRRQPGHLAD